MSANKSCTASVGKILHIHPDELAPYPEQPRIAITGGSFDLLKTSVAASGVREVIHVAKVADCPWVELPKEHKARPYVIVSGHRRHRAASEVGLATVPVMVTHYPDEQSFRDAADELNVGRADLTPLEEAFEIGRRRDEEQTWEQIAKARGMTPTTCVARYQLLNLAPEIQDMIHPEVQRGRRPDLPVVTAQALGSLYNISTEQGQQMCCKYGIAFEKLQVDIDKEGEEALSFALQRAVLEHIQELELSSTAALEFIKDGRRYAKHGRMAREKNVSAGKMLSGISNMILSPTRSKAAKLTEEQLRRACGNLTEEQILIMVEQAQDSIDLLQTLKNRLQTLAERRAEAMVPPLQRFTPTGEGVSLRETDPELFAELAAQYGADPGGGKRPQNR